MSPQDRAWMAAARRDLDALGRIAFPGGRAGPAWLMWAYALALRAHRLACRAWRP